MIQDRMLVFCKAFIEFTLGLSDVLKVSLYFLYFLTSIIFSYLIEKLPIIPIMLELKGKNF